MARKNSTSSHVQGMKGLDQAVNIKLWPGNGELVKPWGKLKQDPELWDDKGDSLIFFSRSRAEPSFRIHSSLLRETGSDTLVDMLLYGTVRSYGNIPGVSHKIYLEPPAGLGGKIDVLRHHITTRNFFAFLQRKFLVGFTFYQALVDLRDRLEKYLPPGTDCVAAMRQYLVEVGLVNVSNEPRAAAGLLAWSEDVRWNEGWREAFVHSVGMYEQLSRLQESADISLPTTAHLDRKYLELQVRIHEIQDCLGKWYFDDVHYALEDEPITVKQASDRFCKFLKQYYQKEYESWPLKKGSEGGGLWLDRRVILRLQEDFGALYEYLVDRNVTWKDDETAELSERDTRRRNKPALQSKSENFWVDADDDRMLGVFRNIDCRLNATDSIPYPYPLLPASFPPPLGAGKRKGLFGKEKTKDRTRESRLAHVYNASTNAELLSREHAHNALVRAFANFERTDQTDAVDPREARRERWIIIYCVLSTLANVSADVPNLSFKENVNYFLNTRLNEVPPWCPEEKLFKESSREQSHCYLSPSSWKDDTYEHRNGPQRSASQHSLSSDSNISARPLSPHADVGNHDSWYQPAKFPTPSVSFKHTGTKPSQFNNLDVKAKDFTLPTYPQSAASEAETESQLSPLTDASPFNNIFEPSSKAKSRQSDIRSSDGFSDYSSVPPLSEGSSGPESSTDRSSSHHSVRNHRGFPQKFAVLAGIEEYETKPLPIRPGSNKTSKGDKLGTPYTR